MKHILTILLATALCASCSIMCKNEFKHTSWNSVEEEFVADAGTMTITTTLKFLPAKKYILETEMYMPAHPAMYMNADGTVDTIPASSSAWAENGTYSVKNNIITLKADDGEVHTLTLESGKLITDNLFYRPLTLTRKN